MSWINLTIAGLQYALAHRKEIAEGAEVGIHVIRRLEQLCVHHKTDVDTLLVHADKALHEYNQKNKDKS